MRRTRSLSELWVADEREEWHLRSSLSWPNMHDRGPDYKPVQSVWRDMFLRCVSGAIFPDACLIKRWKNAQIPKNRSSSLGVVGTGNRLIASTISVGIEIPRESTTCPRNVSDGLPSWHLFLLRRRPLSLSRWKRHYKSLTWYSLHLLPTIKSSMYRKWANGMSLSNCCTLRWKHWAAFLSPYGIRRNLKRPIVVIMSVLSCDASSTCTCWNACRRSILLNAEYPAKRSLKVVSAGRGYLSSFVMAIRRRKSPHTRHEPSGFITACIGDAQLESHRSITFSSSHCLSCSSTCTFFSPCSFLHGVYTGGPSVLTWRGVVMVTTLPRLGSVTSGNWVHRWA